MRFAVLVSLVCSAVGVRAGAAEDCGALGVFKVDPASLPAGVDPARVRTCLEHPLSLAAANVSSPALALGKRACYYPNKAFGCSNSYCWKVCPPLKPRDGHWCWTAYEAGWGAWQQCYRDSDCDPGPYTGSWEGRPDCGRGDCSACGCGC